MKVIDVAIVYPTDPLGIVPGGTDTCIRDILKCAPDDIRIRLIGVTTDVHARPVKQWTTCQVGNNTFDFYPICAVDDLETQHRIPLSLRFTLGLMGQSSAWRDADIIQFHRIEPALLFHFNKTPRFTVIHQNMKVINDAQSDIRWKYLPGAYFRMEDFLLPKFSRIYIVREDAVVDYRGRFPDIAPQINFLPTWMNEDLFHDLGVEEQAQQRKTLLQSIGISEPLRLCLSVGRLDHQKNPELMIESMQSVLAQHPDLVLVMVGDGVLRDQVTQMITAAGLEERIRLLGALPQEDVASWLRAADLLLLSSAYEGMPRCVVEALGCGVPVATTQVGEVGRLVTSQRNGFIATEQNAASFSAAVNTCLDNLAVYRGKPCTDAVAEYSATNVLGGLYDSYRAAVGAEMVLN